MIHVCEPLCKAQAVFLETSGVKWIYILRYLKINLFTMNVIRTPDQNIGWTDNGAVLHHHHLHWFLLFLVDERQYVFYVVIGDCEPRRISKRSKLNIAKQSFLWYLIEKRKSSEIVLLRNGVVFVVMTFGALQRQRQKCFSE